VKLASVPYPLPSVLILNMVPLPLVPPLAVVP